VLLLASRTCSARAHHGDGTQHGGLVHCATLAHSHDTTVHFESDSLVPQQQAISAPRRLSRWTLRRTTLDTHLPALVLILLLYRTLRVFLQPATARQLQQALTSGAQSASLPGASFGTRDQRLERVSRTVYTRTWRNPQADSLRLPA
jgi:hypothetical protein